MSLTKKEWEKLQGKILHTRIISVIPEDDGTIKIIHEILEVEEYVNFIIHIGGGLTMGGGDKSKQK